MTHTAIVLLAAALVAVPALLAAAAAGTLTPPSTAPRTRPHSCGAAATSATVLTGALARFLP